MVADEDTKLFRMEKTKLDCKELQENLSKRFRRQLQLKFRVVKCKVVHTEAKS